MKSKRFAIRAICAAVALALGSMSLAQTNKWQGGLGTDSDWSNPNNWTLGVPSDDQDVVVTDALGGATTVYYNEAGNPNYKTLLIDGVTVVHNDVGGLQVTEKMTVGFDGFAIYDLQVAQQLGIGSGSGGQFIVGASSGSRGYVVQNHDYSFVQVGGDGGDLILGEAAGAYGSYSLTAGTLQVAAYLVVGDTGEGLFTQDGGTANAGILVLGRAEGGLGTYDLNAGTLNDQLIIGDAGVGFFNNNGSQHNVTGEMILGNQSTGDGTYNLDLGGTVTVSTDTIVGNEGKGTFNHVDGDHATDRLIVGSQSGSVGSYKIDTGTLTVATDLIVGNAVGATGSFTQNGGTVVVSGDTIIGNEGSGSYHQVDGDLTTSRLIVGNLGGSIGSFTIDAGTLKANDLIVGNWDPNFGPVGGSFTQNSGQVLVSGGFQQEGGYNGFTSTYTLNDGLLESSFFGSMTHDSVFNHNGGQHDNFGLFIVGNGGGSDYNTLYNIKGASSVANFNDLWVGGFGRGILNQSDGTVNVAGEMRIGDGPNVDPARRFGEYNLTGGALVASNNVIIGAGNSGFTGEPGGLGTFNQTGGDVMISGVLILGQAGTIGSGTGTYNLTAGTLTTADMVVGQQGSSNQAKGYVNQSGGDVLVTGFMTVGEGFDSYGEYKLSGGTLTTGNAIVGGNGIGFLHQTGGSYETVFLNVGGGGFALTGTGNVRIDAGSMTIHGNLVLGNDIGGNGTFDQVGGSVAVNDPTFGVFINNGLYSMGGGTLDVVANMVVGDKATGTFNQTGGTVDVGNRVTLGSIAGVTGNMTLTGGTATVGSMRIGDEGNGVLNVLGAGQLKVTNDPGNLFSISVAHAAGSTGTVDVGGFGSLTASNRLTVGLGGDATFTQGGSSTVSVGGLRVANLGTSTSSYKLNGGTLDVLSTEGVNGGTRVGIAGSGTFTHNGGTHTTTFLEIGGASFGQGGGGSGTYHMNGGSLVSSGNITVNVGGSTGVFNVAGGTVSAPTIVNNDQLNYSGGSITANVTNNKDFNVTGGAARTLTGSLTNNAGGTTTVAASTPLTITGALNQAAGASIVGNANITVGSDYANAGFGSGNTFNRHAGVTLNNGAQIVGQNASQTITATGNPTQLTQNSPNEFTLDLGTVRGNGSQVTLSYQVKNDGNGAGIRGAIQTGVNGASLSDGRLTGTGVSEGVFGPIAAGGNSGNLSVTFTGSSGGALTGQKVAIYSNFDNVPTQILNLTGGVTILANGNATPSPGPVDLGSFRIGGTMPTQQFAVENTVSGSLAERLGIASPITTTGNFSANSNLGAGFVSPGSSSANAVSATVAGGVVGVNNGSMTIQYTTNGQLINGGFGTINANQQTIDLTATGYNVAQGSASPSPINLGNFRVGQAGGVAPQSRNVAVSNTVAGPFTESLGIGSAGIDNAAAFTLTNNLGSGLIAAGGTNNAALNVARTGGGAGLNTGTLAIQYTTDGTGTSGLAAINANSQNITVNATGYLAAIGSATPSPVNFGNVRQGTLQTQSLTVANTQTAGSYSEDLNASFTGQTGAASGSGSISGRFAGTNNTGTGSMSVALDTSTAGARSGTVTIGYETAGAVQGTSNSLGPANAGSQTIDVSGNVIRLAQPNSIGGIDFGNVLLNSTQERFVSISNLAAADGFSEALNAAFGTIGGTDPGRFSVAGSINALAAGASDNTSMKVTLNTSATGSVSATVQILLESNGQAFGFANNVALPTQTINLDGLITAVVGTLAQAGTITPNPVAFGNVRVGTAVSTQGLTISNIATAPAEGLNAGFTGTSGTGISAQGSITSLAPATSDSTTMRVGIDTTSAGSRNGSVTVGLVSDGTFNSGVTTNLPSQIIGVTGGVFEVAQPNLPASVNLGNVRLGSASQAITIGNTNVAPAGYQEGLDASAGGTSGQATVSGGPIANLAAGATSNAISVGLSNIVAGTGNSGTVTLNLASNGTGTSGLPTLALADAVVNVSATGYRLASPTLNTPTVTIAARVGDATTANQSVSITNTSPDIYTEGLKVGIGGASGNAQHNGGSIANLVAGATDVGSIKVGLASTATAGNTNGTVTLNLASTGAGTTGAADEMLASQVVNVNGKIYAPAVAQLDTPVISFGVVRKGTVVGARNVTVTNAAAPADLNDTMKASLGTANDAAFSAGGSVSGLGAGLSNAGGTLTVGLSTAQAGQFNGAVDVSFLSQNPDMADLDLGDQQVTMSATVNEIANPLFSKTGGAGSFGCVGLVCTLDFGNVLLGSGSIAGILQLINDVSDPADDLVGTFNLASLGDFTGTGFDPVDLAPGETLAGLMLGFDASNLGLFTGSFVFSGFSHNAFQDDLALADITVNLRANVVQQGTVPEPGTIWLILLAAGLAIAVRRRQTAPLH